MEYRKKLPKEIKIIQTLRAIAALLVLFGHLWYGRENIVIYPLFNKLLRAGGYGVQIFFIISGFILPYSLRNQNYKTTKILKFMSRRLVRLEPVYLLSILIALILSQFLSPLLDVPFDTPAQSTKDILLHLFYLVPFFEDARWIQSVNWTLAIEFQYYILLGLLAPIFVNSNNKILQHFILIVLSLSGLIIDKYTYIFNWLTFFCAGISLFLYLKKSFSFKDICFQFLTYLVINWLLFESINFLIIIISVPIIIYTQLNKEKLPLQFVGKISYSLYLFHSLTGYFVNNYLAKTYPNANTLTQITILLITTFTSILTAYIIYSLIEKPSTRMSKKIKLQ